MKKSEIKKMTKEQALKDIEKLKNYQKTKF